jgi:hypothetical protein
MVLTSAYLALVLQNAPACPLPQHHPIAHTLSTLNPNASSIHGVELPCAMSGLVDAAAVDFSNERALVTDPGQQHASPILLAEADLGEIVPGLMQDPKTVTVGVGQPAQAAPPTYESWDVLRQYPHSAPLAQPTAPAPKPPETPKPSKESKDAQSKTATD